MPVMRDIPVSLEEGEVLRRMGMGQASSISPQIATLLHELLVSVNKLHLLEPAVAYEFYTITEVSNEGLCLEGNAALHGTLLSSMFAEAKELAVLVSTIGPNLEKESTESFDRGEPLRAMILDSIGNAAVDSLNQEVCRFMMGEASTRGYQASSPVSPGRPSFPISEQWNLFKLVPAEEISVRLTNSGMMIPCKSTSKVIGLGPEMRTWTRAEACDHCTMGKTCPYRVHA